MREAGTASSRSACWIALTAPAGEPTLTPTRHSGPKRRRKAGSHAPQFDLGRELYRISGVDLTRIDGIDVGVAQTLISEVGLDMSRWQDEHHFASWLGRCPDNRITGGHVIRRGTRRVVNRAATALRIGATTLLRSHSYLGAQFRRFQRRFGTKAEGKAIFACAHTLIVMIYHVLAEDDAVFEDLGADWFQRRSDTQAHTRRLVHQLEKLGHRVTLTPAA